MTHQDCVRFAARVALVFSVGCAEPQTEAGSGETGDDNELGQPGEPEVMDDVNGCKGVPYEVGFSQAVPDGFSAADVVAEIEGSYSSELVWSASAFPLEHDLPGTPVAIEFEFDFSAAPEQVRWVESLACNGMISCEISCLSRLEIPAVLRVTAADGTLAEELDVVVGALGDEIIINHNIIPTELEGSLANGAIQLDSSWTLIGYHLQVELGYTKPIRGRVRVSVVDPDDVLWFNALGVWPVP